MKITSLLSPRTLASASAAIVYLIAAPGSLRADDHDHDHLVHRNDRDVRIDHHVVDHRVMDHRNVEHFEAPHFVDHRIAEHVVDHRLVAHRPEMFRERHLETVRFHGHLHHGYVLTYGNGFRGRGFYYGPPNVGFYTVGPDVEYFASRDAVPVEYMDTTADASEAPSPEAAVQAALADRGYYAGPVDGEIGIASTQAIARFQSDNGLTVTGAITPGLLQTLGIN